MKKCIFAAVLSLMVFMSCLVSGAALAETEPIRIVTTIFPIYDWVREIAGNEADSVRITLLLDNGVDLHSYQPTAQDIVTISTADLFIYVGGESDAWVEDVLQAAAAPGPETVNLLSAMGDAVKTEEIVEGMEHEHEHEHEEEEEEHDHDHEEEADEHVWLSLRNAQKLTAVIAETLAGIDPAHADPYRANAAAYAEKLAGLDAMYAETVRNAARRTLLFADRFPFRYLADDYGLTYYAAFSGCSAESEASFQTIVFLAQKVDELGLPVVLTIENPKTRIAETVVDATREKAAGILSMNSLQNFTLQDIRDGGTYLSVMEENLEVLKEALN